MSSNLGMGISPSKQPYTIEPTTSKSHSTIQPKPKEKSLVTAYLCWLIGGIFGLHHIYLHRDRQAFIWWSTLGGYFGVGWVHDMFHMPEMVRDANEDPQFIEAFIKRLQTERKPSFSLNRFISAVMIGYIWGQVAMMAIPEDVFQGINFSFMHWGIPLFVALGVWTVGNVGREKGVLWHCLVAAYLVYPIRFWIYDETYWYTGTVFVCAMVFDTFSKQWRREKPKRYSKKRRIATLSAAVCVYLILLGSWFYFNGKITDSEGDEVPVQEAIHNFWNSPWWTDLKQTLSDTWLYAQHNGWYETWKQIVDQMDVDGEQNAFKVLGVGPTATQSEITSAWRKLSREHHPDKIKDEAQRKIAQDHFMEIQQAYEVISKIKNKRRQKNKKFNEEL